MTGVNQGIHAFNVTSGAKADFAPAALGQHQNLATDGTRLFDVTFENGVRRLTAYNLSNGSVVWTRNGAVTSPLVVNGMVIVGENRTGSPCTTPRTARSSGGSRSPGVLTRSSSAAGSSSGSAPARPGGSTPPLTMFGV